MSHDWIRPGVKATIVGVTSQCYNQLVGMTVMIESFPEPTFYDELPVGLGVRLEEGYELAVLVGRSGDRFTPAPEQLIPYKEHPDWETMATGKSIRTPEKVN